MLLNLIDLGYANYYEYKIWENYLCQKVWRLLGTHANMALETQDLQGSVFSYSDDLINIEASPASIQLFYVLMGLPLCNHLDLCFPVAWCLQIRLSFHLTTWPNQVNKSENCYMYYCYTERGFFFRISSTEWFRFP